MKKEIFGVKKLIISVLFLITLFILSAKFYTIFLPEELMSFPLLNLFAATIVLIIIYAIDKILKFELETPHYLIILTILTLSFIFSPLYELYFYYDKFLHIVQPFILSIVIFHIIKKLNVNLKTALILTVLIIIAFGSIFEMMEFGTDKLLNYQSQGVFLKSVGASIGKTSMALEPIIDTNLDMIFNLIGATAFALFTWFSRKFFRKKSSRKATKHR